MRYPQAVDSHYLNTPVGQQLLAHYARRGHVRRSTRLFPVRIADVVRFLRALGGLSTHHA